MCFVRWSRYNCPTLQRYAHGATASFAATTSLAFFNHLAIARPCNGGCTWHHYFSHLFSTTLQLLDPATLPTWCHCFFFRQVRLYSLSFSASWRQGAACERKESLRRLHLRVRVTPPRLSQRPKDYCQVRSLAGCCHRHQGKLEASAKRSQSPSV